MDVPAVPNGSRNLYYFHWKRKWCHRPELMLITSFRSCAPRGIESNAGRASFSTPVSARIFSHWSMPADPESGFRPLTVWCEKRNILHISRFNPRKSLLKIQNGTVLWTRWKTTSTILMFMHWFSEFLTFIFEFLGQFYIGYSVSFDSVAYFSYVLMKTEK